MSREGTYWAQPIQGEAVELGDKHTPHMIVTCTLADDAGECKLYVACSDAAWPMAEKKLQTLGFNGDWDSPSFSPPDNQGWVEVICTMDTWEGKTREKWELANWGSAGSPLAQAAKDVLRRKWQQAAGGYQAKPAGRRLPAAAPQQADVLTWNAAQAMAAEVGMDKDTLVAMLKARGATGYKPERDTATVREIVEQYRQQQAEAPPDDHADEAESGGNDISF